MTVAGDSNGVYRWKVHSNISDDFVVSAAGSSLVIPEVKEGRVSSRILSGVALPTKNALLLAFPEVFAAGAIGKFLTKVLAIGIIK